ncbi:MAG: hypothetical protein R3F43_19925 [bacterium]
MKPPVWGLRLAGGPADLAHLDALMGGRPALIEGAWQTISGFEDGSYLVVSEQLFDFASEAIAAGVPLVQLPPEAGLPGEVRASTHLLEALRPLAAGHDEVPAEGCFIVPGDDPAATRTVERLLRLARPDATLTQWAGPAGPVLALRLAHPPLYLLLRARDGGEPVTAYARYRDSNLWVAWSWQHPLAAAAAARLAAAGTGALVDADGRWQGVPAVWDQRPLLDFADAALPAPVALLRAAEGEPLRFTVHLRLELDRPRPPSLWVIRADELPALLPLLDATPLEGLGAVTLARMQGDAGVRYVLRLRAGSEDDGLADRLSGLLGTGGYTRVAGAERIFVPAGMRLMPPMRLEALRAVLQPPENGVVLVEATRDGPRILRIGPAPEAPLRELVDYLALDNRATLDALLEEAVFVLPAIQLDRSIRPVERAVRPRPPVRTPPARRPRPAAIAAEPVAEAGSEADQIRAWRLAAEPLQARVTAGGLTDSAAWLQLGRLLDQLGEPDDAGLCLEAAAFHAADLPAAMPALAALVDTRARSLGVSAAACPTSCSRPRRPSGPRPSRWRSWAPLPPPTSAETP